MASTNEDKLTEIACKLQEGTRLGHITWWWREDLGEYHAELCVNGARYTLATRMSEFVVHGLNAAGKTQLLGSVTGRPARDLYDEVVGASKALEPLFSWQPDSPAK
jgi:hypothetical protein